MIKLGLYEGKNVKIELLNGTIFKAEAVDFMIGDDYDEEFNSLSLRIKKVIKEPEESDLKEYIGTNILFAVYENEVKSIEEIEEE